MAPIPPIPTLHLQEQSVRRLDEIFYYITGFFLDIPDLLKASLRTRQQN